MVLVILLACTVCIVLCVFLKENVKLHRLFPGHFKETRPDKNYENEMLKLKFASTNPDDEEGLEAINEGDESGDQKKVMEFYLSMMRKEVCMKIEDDSPLTDIDTNYDDYCYPLCEKKFKNGDVIRHISPCGHIFHEKCIKLWLYRGENQFCPNCRGNIMKPNVDLK